MRNAEYITVVAEAVQAVRRSMAERRLPELTPEQLAWWFRTITTPDVERAMQSEGTRALGIVWRREPDSDSYETQPVSQGKQDWSIGT